MGVAGQWYMVIAILFAVETVVDWCLFYLQMGVSYFYLNINMCLKEIYKHGKKLK